MVEVVIISVEESQKLGSVAWITAANTHMKKFSALQNRIIGASDWLNSAPTALNLEAGKTRHH